MVERRRAIRGERLASGEDPTAILAAGLQELELPFRATLELRYRRGLPDDTIAAVAGFDERVIQRQRQRALAWLAQRTALRGPDAIETVEENLRALSPAAWAGEAEPDEGQSDEPAESREPESEPEESPPAPEPPDDAPRASMPPPMAPPEEARAEDPERGFPSPPPAPEPSARSRGFRTEVSPRTAIGLLALLVAIIALVFLLFSGDSTDESDGVPAPAPAKDSSSKQAKDEEKPDEEGSGGGPVAMEPLPGADLGGGTIEVSMSGASSTPDLEVKLNGLPEPEGEYRGWLYDSVVDSRTLGRARSGDGLITATLPENWQDYPFLDLSIQERESIVHSGESIARIPIADLPSP